MKVIWVFVHAKNGLLSTKGNDILFFLLNLVFPLIFEVTWHKNNTGVEHIIDLRCIVTLWNIIIEALKRCIEA